jgi:hypothetical protein
MTEDYFTNYFGKRLIVFFNASKLGIYTSTPQKRTCPCDYLLQQLQQEQADGKENGEENHSTSGAVT